MSKILKLLFIFLITFFINYDSSKHIDKYYIPIDDLCLVRNITGFPCPGCGMTRAHISALQLDFKKAFYYHPLFIFPSLLFFIVIFKKRLKIADYLYNNNYIMLALFFIFVIVYFIRFILLFPNEEPFTYNYNSKIYTVLQMLKNIIIE